MAVTTFQDATIGDAVYNSIRGQILMGELAQGERLIETELAVTLGVSRTPIREAIRRLVQEGFLEMKPNNGTHVRRITPRDIISTYKVREALEGFSAREAAFHATPRDIDYLHEHAERMNQLHPTRDALAHLEQDLAFHVAVAEISRNRVLIDLQDSLHGRILQSQTIIRKLDPQNAAGEQHRHIIGAIARNDVLEAEQLMRSHLQHFRYMIQAYFDSIQEG